MQISRVSSQVLRRVPSFTSSVHRSNSNNNFSSLSLSNPILSRSIYSSSIRMAVPATTIPTPATSSSSTSSSNEHPITLEKRANGIYIIRFNRPHSLNAMTVQMGEQFLQTITDLTQDKDVRCVILTGEGKAFSAGGDLDFLLQRCDDNPANNSAMMRAFYSRFLSLLQLPVPIIAAINGPAIGAGMCVASACDYRITAKQVDLGFTFTRLGLHPGMGCTHFLPALINQQEASRLLLTGEIIKGTRAAEIGLIGQLVEEPTDVMPAAVKLAEDIASNSPVSIRTLTTSLRMVHQFNLERALYREADAQAQCYATPELRTNVTAIKTHTANRNKNKQ